MSTPSYEQEKARRLREEKRHMEGVPEYTIRQTGTPGQVTFEPVDSGGSPLENYWGELERRLQEENRRKAERQRVVKFGGCRFRGCDVRVVAELDRGHQLMAHPTVAISIDGRPYDQNILLEDEEARRFLAWYDELFDVKDMMAEEPA